VWLSTITAPWEVEAGSGAVTEPDALVGPEDTVLPRAEEPETDVAIGVPSVVANNVPMID